MESSNKILEPLQIDVTSSQDILKDETLQMTRFTVSNKPYKKHKHATHRKLSENIEISETFRLAAKGHGATHCHNVSGESLAQSLIQREEANKKKGFFFLCC